MNRLLAILFTILLPYCLQSQPLLVANGEVDKIEQNGSYYDRKIPHVSSLHGHNYINFNLKGADGGAYKSDINTKKGGGGAIVRVSFQIGTGFNELRPEGIIRFVVGKRGKSVRSSVIAGGGGGGGTAILYRHPNANITCNQVSTNLADAGSCWVLLAVAGGGGGAYLEQRGKGGNDGTCGKNGGDGDGGNGGCNGNGGHRGTDGNDTASGGGGGAFTEGGGGPQSGTFDGRFGGGEGNYTGGVGGVSGSGKDGGFGYGGGGSGGQALAPAGGGGGGGYSGGGGGYYSQGGGGGSFANAAAQEVDKEEGSSDASPDPGHVIYQFVTQEGPTARCNDITVTLSNGSATINGQSLDDGSIAEPGETINGTLIGVEINPGSFFIRFDYTYDCLDLGEHTVKLIVQSSSGKIDECLSRVEVIDEVAPTVNCTSSVLDVVLDANGQYEFSADELIAAGTVSDACGEVVDRYIGATFSCSQTGIQTVPLIVEDNSGNTGSCQLTVNVNDENVVDQIPPVLACNDVTVTLDANGQATVTAAEIGAASSDNCSIQLYEAYYVTKSGGLDVFTNFPRSFDSCSPLTTYTGNLVKVVDAGGNETTGSCTATITLLPYSGTNRWYVDRTVSRSGGGTSWSCAFKTLQEALLYADDGDEIWVAGGTYYPDEGPGQTNNDRLSSFTVQAGVSIYGGFAGGETSLAERDWHVNVTTLSGDLMQNDSSNFSNYSDNAYHVLTTADNFSTPVLFDGLVIRGGNAEGRIIESEGGAIAEADFEGGGVLMEAGGEHTFAHCVFVSCYAQFGGALITRAYAPIALTDCTFENNKALNRGGAVAIRTISASITNSIFRGNEAGDDGAAILSFSEDTDIINCLFSGNEAPDGVIYSESPDMSLINCSLSGNAGSTLQSEYGAATSLDNCILWGNESAITACGGCPVTVNYSIIQGGYAGTGNLDIDPLFVSQPPVGLGLMGDLRLQACSPALDAASDNVNDTQYDLAGNDRRFDAIPGGSQIDMGAYEHQTGFAAVCRNQTVSVDETGSASLDVSLLDGGMQGCPPLSFDVDGETVLTFDCDDVPLSPFTYTVSVSDANGSQGTCTATVEVVDLLPPVISCKSNYTIALETDCQATLLPAALITDVNDNCTPTENLLLQLGYQPDEGEVQLLNSLELDQSDIGNLEIEVFATDAANNTNVGCMVNLTVIDQKLPIAVCRDTALVQLYGLGTGTLSPEEVDNGSGNDLCGPVTLALSQTDFDCTDIGLHPIILTVTDAHSNSSICQTIAKVVDLRPPTISCVTDYTITIGEQGQATLLPDDLIISASDNCTPTDELQLKLVYETEPDQFELVDEVQFDCDDLGLHVVGGMVFDIYDNHTIPCLVNVTVEHIETEAVCQDVIVHLDHTGIGTLTPDQVYTGPADFCSVFELNQTEFGCLDVGPREVILTLTNVNGNTSSCTAAVQVVDDHAPSVSCVESYTVSLNDNGQAILLPSELITSALDNCTPGNELQQQIVYDAGNGDFQWVNSLELSCEDVGILSIGVVAYDLAGNYSPPCEIEIVVDDNGSCTACETTLSLSGNIPEAVYRAAEWIESDGTISAGTSVTFLAGTSIRLTPGFHAASSSGFTARIEDCEPAANSMVALPSEVVEIAAAPSSRPLEWRVYPNPFRDRFTLVYELMEETEIEIRLISMDGRINQQLLPPQFQLPGTNQLEWGNPDLPAGIYFMQLRQGNTWSNQKLVKMR